MSTRVRSFTRSRTARGHGRCRRVRPGRRDRDVFGLLGNVDVVDGDNSLAAVAGVTADAIGASVRCPDSGALRIGLDAGGLDLPAPEDPAACAG